MALGAPAFDQTAASTRMTTDLTPPPAGARSSTESDKDLYITQLIRRLETLHMSTVVNTKQVSILASISNVHEKEPTTCCSQAKSSEVLQQHKSTQLRMLSHRWQRLGLQPPTLWSTQEHVSEHNTSAVETRPAMEISPIEVTLIVSSGNKETDEMKAISNLHCSSSNASSHAPVKGYATEQCSLNNSTGVSVECEDSDLSDQEKDNIPISKWATPVELDLRPDSFDRDLELTETAEEEQVYPEVLPVPLKDLDFSHSPTAELESQQNLYLSDPCLTAMVARMLELEKLQTATIQREQGKAVRSRPATALVRSANRLRQVESPCYHTENMRTRGNNSVLPGLTKLNLSSSSRSRSRQHTCPLSHSDKVQNGVQAAPTLQKKPNSNALKFKKTEALVHNIADHSNVSQKFNHPNTSRKRTPTNKARPKSQKTYSGKTRIPIESSCNKT